MDTSLAIFDNVQTVSIVVALVITIPLAIFVYFKLLFTSPFAQNYAFKLIVANGTTGILSTLAFLFFPQLTSFSFMFEFYQFIKRNDLIKLLSTLQHFLLDFSLHSALFVALNRTKRFVFERLDGSDSVFFYVSMILSFILSLPTIISNTFYSTIYFVEYFTFDQPMLYPKVESTNKLLQNFSNIIPVTVSIVTLFVNIFLAIAIIREGRYQSNSTKSYAERGLLISSVVAYAFYMLYFINNLLARYLQFWFSGNAQFLFVGLAGITPFWCLIIFAPSVRRAVFSLSSEKSTVQSVAHQSATVSS